MKKGIISHIATLLSVAMVTSTLFLLPINAVQSPVFIGRGGSPYETQVNNDDGSATVTTIQAGGGVKSSLSYSADDLIVDIAFSADTVANLPAGNQYILSFTDIQHATPNGDDSKGFYFVLSLHDPDAGLQGIIADVFPYTKPTTGAATAATGTSRYLPINENSSFHIVKKANGKYTVSLINKFYAEPSFGNQILFDDVDLSGCIGAQGLFVNMYLAAGSNFSDNYTIDITGTEPDPAINGLLPYGSTALAASGSNAASFTNPAIGQGAYTQKRVKLDGAEITLKYDGNIGDANGYLLAFSNVAGSNMLSNDVRQKGFYFVVRLHDNLGVADGNNVTSGIIIRENVKKGADGIGVAFSESEKKEVFSQGKFLRESDTATFKFTKVGTEGRVYNMYYKDDYTQTQDLLMLENVDLADYIDADGCIYVNYFFADQQQADQNMTFTFGVNGIYTDAASETMPDIVEEGDPITLSDINGFTFNPAEVLNANAQALSYNGVTMTGKSFRTAVTQTNALAVDDLEFELTTEAGAAGGSYYQISIAKEASPLDRDAASVAKGFIFTLQCTSDANSGIYNIFGWNGDQSLGAGISKRFTDGTVARLKLTKADDGTYTLWYKGDASLSYEQALSNMNLDSCINQDGNAYFSIIPMSTSTNANYSVSLLTMPIPGSIAQAKIDETTSLVSTDYTSESWQTFVDARSALQEAITNGQENINDLYATFLNSLSELSEQDPIVLLYEKLLKDIADNFIEDATMIENQYDAAKWQTFETAKASLTEWYNNDAGYDILKPLYDQYIVAKQDVKNTKTNNNPNTGNEPLSGVVTIFALSALSILFVRKFKAESQSNLQARQ